MGETKGVGRPSLRRNVAAGRNLRAALKLLGKTWRKNVDDPNHIRNWSDWIEFQLPTSPTTIDGDMREGVPEKRIAGYALCLGVSPADLCSFEANMVQLLGSDSMGAKGPGVYPVPGHHDQHAAKSMEYNRPQYIDELFSVMGGVYRMYYLLSGVDLIHRCTLWYYGVEKHRLLMRGGFVMFGMENNFEASVFRWHNNIHTHYLCENGLELGYALTVDPLRHNIVRGRNPFWLRGTGMTDRGLADNQPVTFTFHKKLLSLPEGMTQEELWKWECNEMLAHPFIAPSEAEYGRLFSIITNPEVLI